MRRKKATIIAVCVAAIAAVSVVGSLAYLTDTTGPVENTFTIGKLLDEKDEFVLKEHDANETKTGSGVYTLDMDTEVDGNEYTVLPGVDIPKDPFVATRDENGDPAELKLDAYVFVEVVDDTGDALSFTVDTSKWTELSNAEGPNGGKVYMIGTDGLVTAGTSINEVILAKNTNGYEITVEAAVITDPGSIEFYGYMIQAGTFADAAAAWAAGFAGETTPPAEG